MSNDQDTFDFNADADAAPGEPRPQQAGKTEPAALQDDHGPLRRLMDYNFMEYASYVICDRAIPALEDGLKPVQRRILWSLAVRDDGRFNKVANIVGHCMQYHPHGDASIGDALVNLVNKSYLIEGQGNFGNLLTGDRAAAARYIECRLTELARKELFNNNLTEFVPTYDGRNKEPVLLPVKIPLLLMLGAEGIAVGMSTRILPHNFGELLTAQIAILQKKPFKIFPDFAQGGRMDVSEYNDGAGRVRIRARIEEREPGSLVITELPFGVTTESLIASIEEGIKSKKLAIKSINDFTSEHVEIELVLRTDGAPDKVKQALYAFTSCEVSVSGHGVVIQDGRPVEMAPAPALQAITALLVRTLTRELAFRKRELLEALHSKTLVQIFVEHRIYKRIEECKTQAAVEKAVLDGLAPFRDKLRRDVTQQDVEMLLSIRIRRISLFDMNKNKSEIESILDEMETVEKDIAGPVAYAVRYVKTLLKNYGDAYPRRTEIASFNTIELRELTAKELQLRYDKETGYLGYGGVEGAPLLDCSSYDKLIFVWKDGRYRVGEPPEKLFVDQTLIYCAKFDRDREFTTVYTVDHFSYLKRFQFGGIILNKEYRFASEGAVVQLFEADAVEEIFVKYRAAKNQRIHQQVFKAAEVPVKSVKARGNHMTGKSIAAIATRRPRWWKEGEATPRGVTLDLL